MFVSQAHSFRRQARLAVTLAWIAGYTDVVTLVACGAVTSHMSGTTANFGRELLGGSRALAGFAFFILVMFLVGAAVSGFCTELGYRRGWESIYVLPMIVEALLLGIFAILLNRCPAPLSASVSVIYWMTGLAAAAMGVQNATITRISSGEIRTTHVTGTLTDLGHELVQFFWWLWDKQRDIPPGSALALVHGVSTHPTARRLVLLGLLMIMFALGGGLGVLAYHHTPQWAMLPPVGFLLWLIYLDFSRPIAEIEAATLHGSEGLDLPPSLAMFHLRKDRDRQGHVHRMPNLLAWAKRLPPAVRVVILDLGEATELDANAALDLRDVIARLAKEGRRMVISGIDRERFEQISPPETGPLIPLENVCADLDLAVAMGLNLLKRDGEAF